MSSIREKTFEIKIGVEILIERNSSNKIYKSESQNSQKSFGYTNVTLFTNV